MAAVPARARRSPDSDVQLPGRIDQSDIAESFARGTIQIKTVLFPPSTLASRFYRARHCDAIRSIGVTTMTFYRRKRACGVE
jgi:hypothetical protein